MASRSSRLGPTSPGTRPRPNQECSWPNAGSSPRLRHRHFTSLGEANAAIAECVDAINSRPFKKLDGSRKILFEALDRPALRPLPPERYEFATWRQAKVNIDYHIEADHHYYSVPYQLVGKVVYVRSSATTIEAFYSSKRVASHLRSFKRGQFTTDPAHMPESHPALRAMDPEPHHQLGEYHRPLGREARRGDHQIPAPSRAGLPLRARHHPPRRSLRHRTRRGGVWPGTAPARLLVSKRAVDPCPLARQTTLARGAPESSPSPPPQRARGDLLPVKGRHVLSNTTIEGLHTLRLQAMASGVIEQREQPDYAALGFEDRLGLLVDRELLARSNRRLTRMLKSAKLKVPAVIEDLDFRRPRGLERQTVLHLAECHWVNEHQAVLIVGPTGVGKTYLSCALAHCAIRHGAHGALPARATDVRRARNRTRRRPAVTAHGQLGTH
jgi:hypothetical protein